MGYTEQQKNKISKYYYRMNKACNQQNVTKISNYFDHLKYHVMTGGTTTEDVNKTITEISNIITNISNSPEVKGIEEYKKNINELNSINSDNYDVILSEVARDTSNPLNSVAGNLAAILKQLKEQGGENSTIYKELFNQKQNVDNQLVEVSKQLGVAEEEKTTAVDNALTGINTSLAGIQTSLQGLMTTLGITPTSVSA
jgi:uncharacterized coiled-coil DUF342 family protein